MKTGNDFDRGEDSTGHAAAEINDVVLAFEMTNAIDPGDGTVPAISGAAPHRFAPDCVRAQLAVLGIDHQRAYKINHDTVMQFIAYSVCKIVKDAQ